jgi:hypothetical protein
MLHADTFQDLVTVLHQCDPACVQIPCLVKQSIMSLASIVLDTCIVAERNLVTPHEMVPIQTGRFIHDITVELWNFYDMTRYPIEWGGYTLRNQVIHHAMYVKVRAAFRREANFPGWQT